jgi:hypothetical protein
VLLAGDLCLDSVVFETDCKTIADSFGQADEARTYWGDIIRVIQRNLGLFSNFHVRHVGSNSNWAAHIMAQIATRN